jgi:hypothetical protein
VAWQTHLELDSDRGTKRFQGYASDELAAFGEAAILWNDPQGRRASALFQRFAEGVLQAMRLLRSKTDEARRQAVASAARHAVEADAEFLDSRRGYFTFVSAVLDAESCEVYALGPYFILHIGEGEVREVVAPQSGASDLVAAGTPRSKALEVAGVTTCKAVIPGGEDFEPHIRVAKIDLRGGEWLLVTPESKGLLDLALEKQPETLDDIRDIIEVLARPYASFGRSWLAIHRL